MSISRRKRRNRLEFSPDKFPALNNQNHRVTSDPVEEQNCIAYVAGDDIHFWWPVTNFPGKLPPPYFWPLKAPFAETIDAFVSAYELVYFERCGQYEDGGLEDNIEKLALFAKNFGGELEPTHAAIQSPLRNGLWRSKMGEDEDIEHKLSALVGELYGDVVLYMRRTMEKRRAAIKMLKNRIPSH